MLVKLSNLNANFALTLGYLNPALNNSALDLNNPSETAFALLNNGRKMLFLSAIMRKVIHVNFFLLYL